MRIVIDTSAWSFFLRRKPSDLTSSQRRLLLLMREVISEGRAILPGVVRQELLSGIRDRVACDALAEYLRCFDEEPPDVADYEQAARFDNRCRAAGIAGSPIDMLVCAIAHQRDLSILTLDDDFEHYVGPLSISRYPIP
jgi:predicted nucleic acid-binding protein